MNLTKNLAEFKANNCTTLCLNERTGQHYVKVPVEDYQELSIIKMNLLSAIELIVNQNETSNSRSPITHSIGTLIKISRAFDLHDECMGLAELIKE